MDGYYNGQTEHFALYLDDGMPLLGTQAAVEIDTTTAVPTIRLLILLEETSAEELNDSDLFGDLELPESSSLEPIWLQLELEAHETLYQQFPDFFQQSANLATAFLNQAAPKSLDFHISPFYVINNYDLKSWAVHQTKSVPDDLLALAKKPPRPLDEA
jgi:hypothetical protein